jgi:1-acyl-sn-glycerol-3-phosphate acyltransferase
MKKAHIEGSVWVRRLVSPFLWIGIAIVCVLACIWMAIVFVVTVPFDPGRYTVGRWFRRAAVACVKINPFWKFHTSGVRISDPRRPYVAVANHESYADIFLLSHLPWEMKWLSKDLIFKLPVMGWMMTMAGDIAVRRKDPQSRMRAMEECRDRLRKKVSVMILPEGTRSATGELLPFKDGAFRLAVEEQVPILPVVVAGTRDAMPKGSFLFGRAVAEARVLPPIDTTGATPKDVPRLREEVRELIRQERDRLFQELGIECAPARSRSRKAEE